MSEAQKPICGPIKGVIIRKKLKDCWRKTGGREVVTWETVHIPGDTARAKGLPKVSGFPGLLAVIETAEPSGAVEWRFLWKTRENADGQYTRCVKEFGPRAGGSAASADIRCIRAVSLPRRTAWQWGKIFVFTGAIAAIGSNVANLQDLADVVSRKPGARIRAVKEVCAAHTEREIILNFTGDAAQRVRFKDCEVTLQRTHDDLGNQVAAPATKVDVLNLTVPAGGVGTWRLNLMLQEPGKYLLQCSGRARGLFRSYTMASQQIGELKVRRPARAVTTRLTMEPPVSGVRTATVSVSLRLGQVGQRFIALYLQIPFNCSSALAHCPRGIVPSPVGTPSEARPLPPAFNLLNVPASDFTDFDMTLIVKIPEGKEKEFETALGNMECYEISPPPAEAPPAAGKTLPAGDKNP